MTSRTTPLYVVCSPCRGIGKTLVSRLLTEFHVIDNRPVAALDLADEGPQLVDYLPEFTTLADIGDTRGQMALFDRLIADQDTAKVIDLSHRVFKNFFTVVHTIGFFEEARRHSIEPLILFLIGPDPKSPKAYAMLRRWFPAASLMSVRNRSAATAIPHGDASPDASIDIPILGASLKERVDGQSFSFSRFRRTIPDRFFDPLDGELRSWMEGIFLQFRNLELRLAGEETSTRLAPVDWSERRTIHAPLRLGGSSQWDVEAAGIDQRAIEVPKEVLRYAPKKYRLRSPPD